jgi:hypothetical protein
MPYPASQISNQTRQANGHLSASTAQRIAALSVSVSVSDEAIATRAYEKFVARGCAHGFDREDWASAKNELMAETYAEYGTSPSLAVF